MEISIEELNALSDRTGAMQVRIAELERALTQQQDENTRLRGEMDQMKMQLVETQNASTMNYMENIYLRNCVRKIAGRYNNNIAGSGCDLLHQFGFVSAKFAIGMDFDSHGAIRQLLKFFFKSNKTSMVRGLFIIDVSSNQRDLRNDGCRGRCCT